MRKLIVVASMLCLLMACRKEETEDNTERVNSMYRELCETYRAYTDSMSLATDTLGTAERLEESLDTRLLKIYKKYPADFDNLLSPSQNDTLWALTQKYMKQRNLRIGQRRLHADTIPADTMQLPDAI